MTSTVKTVKQRAQFDKQAAIRAGVMGGGGYFFKAFVCVPLHYVTQLGWFQTMNSPRKDLAIYVFVKDFSDQRRASVHILAGSTVQLGPRAQLYAAYCSVIN